MKKLLNEETQRIRQLMRLNEQPFNDDGEPMMTHQQYRDYSEPSEPDYDNVGNDREQTKMGLSSFNVIDWRILHEDLVNNTGEYQAHDYVDDGVLSEEDIDKLQENGIIDIVDGKMALASEKYRDYQSFLGKVMEIWDQNGDHRNNSTNDSEAPYLRGREIDEGNAFVGAAKKAKAEGKDSFKLDGKTYKVTVKKSENKK